MAVLAFLEKLWELRHTAVPKSEHIPGFGQSSLKHTSRDCTGLSLALASLKWNSRSFRERFLSFRSETGRLQTADRIQSAT